MRPIFLTVLQGCVVGAAVLVMAAGFASAGR